jgi:hypothetical protein
MRFQDNADQVTGFLDNDPCGSIGYRENPGTGFDPIVADIFLESVRNFLWQKSNLCLFSALGISNDNLSFLNIYGFELQNFADTQAATGH